MRPERRILPDEIYFVTIRTVEQRFALEPHAAPGCWLELRDAQLDFTAKLAMQQFGEACVERTEMLTQMIAESEQNSATVRPEVLYSSFTDSIPNIIGSCMARGAKKFNIRIYGFVWMSNHGHLLLGGDTKEFADFMAYLNGQVAVNVNRFLERENHLWARRYTSAPVLDETAELQMLGYLLANPQNAGIATSIDAWPGLSSAKFLFQNIKQRFLSFDRTAWHKMGRPRNIAPFLSTVVLEQTLLPQLARLDEKARRRKVRRAIKSALKLKSPIHTTTDNAENMPVRRTFTRRIFIATDRPESALDRPRRRSKQPLCHTSKPSLRAIFMRWNREFRIAYKACSRQYRMGNINIRFPPGCFAPSRHPVAVHALDEDISVKLNPSRLNLELADALEVYAA